VLLTGRTLEFVTDQAVAGARIELLESRGRRIAVATSDSTGVFRFEKVAPGEYSLRASAYGFRDVTTPAFNAAAGEPVDVVVRLGIDVVPLAPLEVVTRPAALHRNVALSGFMERATRTMGGAFVMREELEERSPRQVSDMLRTVGSFTVLDPAGGRSMGGTIFNNRAQCEPLVYLDGILISNRPGMNAFNAANSVHWSSLEGMELYSGAATVPAQFSGSQARCGVIAMWSRR
jgi:hypothetical protein